MYQAEGIYSLQAHQAWLRRETDGSDEDLRQYREEAGEIARGPSWEVGSWDELRAAISFLTLMNKRHVLYFRGQKTRTTRCLPVLLRDEWYLGEQKLALDDRNRGKYYTLVPELARWVLQVARQVGTPRSYVLEHVPAAAASVLQHYELWPTQFIDVTRSLPTAIAFAEGKGDRDHAYIYVFALPDLRGSITSDMDQHLMISRLEAVCPPAARRPHHQDAYLIARFPEPIAGAGPRHPSWEDWERKSDLMRRLCARFKLKFTDGRLPGTPAVPMDFLIPPLAEDRFGRILHQTLMPVVQEHVSRM
jgi:hypothetical protein